MPIFNNELIDNIREDGTLADLVPVLGSYEGTKLESGALFAPVEHKEFSLDELRQIKTGPSTQGFGKTFTAAPQSELLANQRYPVYQRGVDLENVYGLQQSWYQQLGNGVAKLGANIVGTFAQSMTNIPNTISAAKNADIAKLSGDPNGYEGTIDNWMKNMDDVFPNYMTRYERDHPFKTMIPFTRGSANWWGGKFLPNIGFMIGAVGGAAVQDLAVGFVTEGIGEIPLVASQLGKAALYLNKVFSAETKLGRALGATELTNLGRVTELAKDLGKTESQILNMTKLAQLSAAAKVNSGFRYGMAVIGSAMTEAGVESRDAYRQVKDDLTKQYIAENGVEPDFNAAQDIENYATNAMNARFGINMALLTASNTLQFGSLFKSMTAAKGAVQQLGDIGKVGLAEGSLDVFEKKATKTIAGKVWESVKPGAGNVLREGVLEEGAQFAAEKGTYDYYTRKYKSNKYKETWQDLNEVMKSTAFGMKEQFGSQEGIENMLIGGLTGLLIGKVQNMYENKKGIGKDAKLGSALTILNRFGITNTLQRQYDSTVTQAGIAKDMQEAVKSGNVFQYKNLQEDAFFNFVNYRLPSGMHDVTIMQLEMLKDLPKDQFEQMFQLDFNETNKGTVNEYVDALIDRANGIKKTTDAINTVFINPFKNNPKEGDIESQVESDNHDVFENYKLDLSYYASIAPNVTRRLNSIQQDVNSIVPGLSNDMLSQLFNDKKLTALSESYEQRANQLNATITESTSVQDKIKIKNQVIALRTRSEKIAMALAEGSLTSKLFQDLLNFEINGQDDTKDGVIPIEQVQKLIGYGEDINKLNSKKYIAADAYDKLSTKEGFEKYFEQAEQVASDKEAAAEETETEEKPEEKPLEEKKIPVYKNKAGAEEALEIGREYQIPKAKVASVKKIADDRWEVSYPGGTPTFYKTQEDAKLAATDINNTLGNLQKVKILAFNDDGTIKIENLKGDIFNIQPSRLLGYERLETKEEKFAKAAGEINRQQKEFEKKSGEEIVPGTPPSGKEGKLKNAAEFFASGTGPSEAKEDFSQVKPHVLRPRIFLNNAKNFKNKEKLRAIIVTPTQLEGLGLSGLAQLSNNLPLDTDLATVPEITDVELGFVAQVFVEEDGGKLYFVDEKGERISEVNGQPTDLSRVVFMNMPTTSLYYNFKDKDGNPIPKYKEGEKDLFEAHAKSWGKLRRDTLFKNPAFPTKVYKFNISRGIFKSTKSDGANIDRNQVGNVIIPENKIATQKDLIVITREEFITHQGKNIGWKKGNPAIQFAETLEHLNNTKFSRNKATSVYQVFKALADDVMAQFNAGKKVTVNKAYITYLQNVLYYRSKGQVAENSNQFFIDTANMALSFGGEFYKLDSIGANEKAIIDKLTATFHNLNSFTLDDNFYKPFYEYVYQDGALKEVEWTNYQSYLLSSKYPDGKPRGIDETPFLTNVAKPTAAVPYSFEQKYATLIDVEFPPIEMPKPAAKPPAPEPSTSDMIGTFKMDGKTVNTFNEFSVKPVEFTGTIDEKGKPSVEVIANEAIRKFAEDNTETIVKSIIPNLQALGVYDASADDVEHVTKFVAFKLAVELEKLQQQKAPGSTDAKADIETRRQEALLGGFKIEDTRTSKNGSKPQTRLKINSDGTKITFEGFYEDKPNTGLNPAFPRMTLEEFRKSEFYKNLKPESKELLEEMISDNEGSVTGIALNEIRISKSEGDFIGKGNSGITLTILAKNGNVNDIALASNTSEINAKYDAELAALEGTKPVEGKSFNVDNTSRPDNYMRIGIDVDEKPMTEAELEAFKKFHAEKVPGLPFEVLENTVTTYDNEKAFGVYENGVAKFYRGAPGTAPYHELGEGIWNAFLTPEEQQLLIDEFKAKSGQFTDRASKKQIYYADATDQQAKERILDDWAEFRDGKIKAKSLGQRVLAFFKSIIEFFKSFVQKPSMKEQLFKAIESGKFKNYKVSEEARKAPPEYMRIPGLTETQAYYFVQDMTIRSGIIMFGKSKKDVYKLNEITGKEIFDIIEQEYIRENKRQQMSDAAWIMLKKRTIESLRTTGVNLTDEDVTNINAEGTTGLSYAPEPFAVNWKKNSPYPIKLLSFITPKTNPTNQQGSSSLKLPEKEFTPSVLGLKMAGYGRIMGTLFNKLSNTTDPKIMVEKLIELAKYDSDFVRLYQYLGGVISKDDDGVVAGMAFDSFKDADWRLFIQFYQTFSLQKPEAYIQYVTGAQVYTQPANQFTAAKEIEYGWYQGMKTLSEDPESLIVFDRVKKTYTVDLTGTYKSGELKDTLKYPPTVPKGTNEQIAFLEKLGIKFELSSYNSLKSEGQAKFSEAVGKIHTYLKKTGEIGKIDGKELGINAHVSTLANLLIESTNPIQESTYPGVDGTRLQSFTQNNYHSVFENEFNSVNTLEDLIRIRPELQDVFSESSVVLMKNGLFYDAEGNRMKLFKVSYIQGERINDTNDGTVTSDLTLGLRMTQEINQNLNGQYYILLPADSSTEWMLNLGNYITFEDVYSNRSWNRLYKVFNGYLKDEINLALDWENRSKIKNVGDKAKELRFFKEILSTFDKEGKLVPSKTLTEINKRIEDGESIDQIMEYVNNKDVTESINDAIKVAVEDNVRRTKYLLMSEGQINYIPTTDDSESSMYSYPKLDNSFASNKDVVLNKYKLSDEELTNVLTFARMNYMIANIEFHKVLFGDPYQFKIKNNILDELKRIKSFGSPRRMTFDMPEFNSFLNDEYNTIDDKLLDSEELGYHLHKDYARTITVKDVEFATSNYKEVNEADADSWLKDTSYRELKLKNAQWPEEAEKWHQWQMAYTRQNMPGYKYQSESLRTHDEALVKKPEPVFVIEKLKPVATGSKDGSTKIDLVLDKYAMLPIYYKAVKGTNLEKLYIKMWKEKVDYAVMISGRKVGAEELQSLYDASNDFNNTPYDNFIDVSWDTLGIQVENSYDHEKDQTWGSQPSKISSMDMFSDGEEAMPGAKIAYGEYVGATIRYHSNKYQQLLNKLGLEDLGNGFKFDPTAVANTLEAELFKRQLSENVKYAIQLDENKQFPIPFEASTHYKQIKDILYSMINKSLVSPKLNGAPKPLSSVTLWENGKRDPNAPNPKLKFYTEDDPYIEILLPYKYRNKFNKKRFPTDESVLEYLNSTPEGKKIIQGVAFRIPCDAQNKIETYRIAGFLPQFMDAVIGPSELVAKAGLDFDFDKENIYMKSVYTDKNGNVRLVQYLDSEEATKEFFAKLFDEKLEKKKVSKSEIMDALNIREIGLPDPNNLVDRYSDLLDIFLENATPEEYADTLMKELEKLGDADLQVALKEKFVDDMYNRALENDYYQALENMLILRDNLKRRLVPTDDAGLKDVSKEINDLRGQDDNKLKNRLLDGVFMTSIRHYFSTGKKWVGIVATNITSHSLYQKTKVTLDTSRFGQLTEFEQSILGDGKIVLPHNTIKVNGQDRVSLSGTKTADGNNLYISDRLAGYGTAVVDIAKDPFIIDIIYSDLLISTVMFLERVGAGKSVSKFINQPIIRKYISYIESQGERGLFSKKKVDYVTQFFPTTDELIDSVGIDVNNLDKNIENYAKGTLTEQQNAEQHNILKEFLKYAKMAQYSFKLTQAINYDTSKSRNSDAFSRKNTKTTIAQQKNIFCCAEDILKHSFIENQRELIDFSMSAMGEIIKTERDDFTIITDDVISPYEEVEYMSDDVFEKIASKAKASFLDFIIQTKSKLNEELPSLTLGENSVANQLEEAKQKYKNIQLLNDLQVTSSDIQGGAKSIKLRVKIVDPVDENLYTEMMRELNDIDPQLFNGILKIAIMQGAYDSSISIKNIIPPEKYSEFVKPIIDSLAPTVDVQAYSNGSFQKNNWKDNDVVPVAKITFKVDETVDPFEDQYGNVYEKYTAPYSFVQLEQLGIASELDRRILIISPRYSDNTQYEFLKVRRITTVNDKTGEKIDIKTGMTITDAAVYNRRKSGDFSVDDVYGYQKVRDGLGNPVVTGTGAHVYKQINLLGDGQFATEHYLDDRRSIYNNGSEQLDNVIPDADIIDFFNPKSTIKQKVTPTTLATTPVTPPAAAGKIKLKGKMTYGYGANKRSEIKANSTFDAILSGQRVASTRYKSDENIDYWKSAKVGDTITWEAADGRTVDVEVTRALHPLKGSGKTAEQWSKLEGWSVEYFNNKVRPRLDEAFQIEYKLPKQVQPSISDQEISNPLPGVQNIANSGLTVEQSNNFIDILQPQIAKQSYIENKARTANMMFSFGLRWARNVPNPTEISEQGKNLQPRPNRKQITSKEGETYGYYLTDQNNNPLPSMDKLQPIMDFIQSKLGIDMSNYDAMLGNIYDENSFIHQHRDTTESITAEKYPVVVINLGADGHLEYDKDVKSTYGSYKKSGELNLTNGGIYAFGVNGESRFTFHHRIGTGLESANPLKPITLPNGQTLTNYRITLTFRRASDLEPGMPTSPKILTNQPSTNIQSRPVEISVKKDEKTSFKLRINLDGTVDYVNTGNKASEKDTNKALAKQAANDGFLTRFTFNNTEYAAAILNAHDKTVAEFKIISLSDSNLGGEVFKQGSPQFKNIIKSNDNVAKLFQKFCS